MLNCEMGHSFLLFFQKLFLMVSFAEMKVNNDKMLSHAIQFANDQLINQSCNSICPWGCSRNAGLRDRTLLFPGIFNS